MPKRDRNGAEVWLVAVKCTFDIMSDGSTVVSKDQLVIAMTQSGETVDTLGAMEAAKKGAEPPKKVTV